MYWAASFDVAGLEIERLDYAHLVLDAGLERFLVIYIF